MIEKIAMWYFILGTFTVSIGTYRSITDKQSIPGNPLDALSWFIMWWVYLPIFIVRFIKYKIRGKQL